MKVILHLFHIFISFAQVHFLFLNCYLINELKAQLPICKKVEAKVTIFFEAKLSRVLGLIFELLFEKEMSHHEK